VELLVEVTGRTTEDALPQVLCDDVIELVTAEPRQQPLYVQIHLRLLTDADAEQASNFPGAPEPEEGQPEEPLQKVEEEQPAEGAPAPETPPQEVQPEGMVAPSGAPPEPAPAQSPAGAKPITSASDSPVADVVQDAIEPAPAPESAAPPPSLPAVKDEPLLEVKQDHIELPVPHTMEEFRQQTAQAVASIQEPPVHYTTFQQFGSFPEAGGGGRGPESLLDPKPVPKTPPKATKDNPVPHAMWLIDKSVMDASGKEQLLIPKVELPAFEESPQHNMPQKDDKPVTEGEMAAAAQYGQAYQARADAFDKQFEDPNQQVSLMPPGLEDPLKGLTPEEDHIRQIYEKLRKHPDPPPPLKKGEKPPGPDVILSRAEPSALPPLRAKDFKDPKDKALDQEQREAVAQTFSYLLAEPAQTVDDALADVANLIAPGGIVHRKFPNLGAGQRPGLQAELEKQFRDMAIQAGATSEMLDKAIADRKAALEEKKRAQLEMVNQMCFGGALDVAQQSAAVSANAGAAAQTMKGHAGDVAAQAAKLTPAQQALATRDRLLTQVTEKSTAYNARFKRILEERKSDLVRAQSQYADAYVAAEQRDEIQIRDIVVLTPEGRQDQITASKNWLAKKSKEVETTFDGFKSAAETATAGFIAALDGATIEANKEIREWAATKTGETRSADQALIDAAGDWFRQVQARADASQALQNRTSAAAANDYISFYVDLKKKDFSNYDKTEKGEQKRLSDDKKMIAAAQFGKSGQDPIELIANGIRTRFMADKRDKLMEDLRAEMLTKDNWRALSEVGMAIGPLHESMEAHARSIHDDGLHGGIFGRNDVPVVMTALTGLNDVQVVALNKAYVELFDMTLDYDLSDQLDEKGEYDRTGYLLAQANIRVTATMTKEERAKAEAAQKDLQVKVVAAEIYSAGEGQWGTDEKAIFAALRKLDDPKQRQRLIEFYKEHYHKDDKETLQSVLDDELNDWASSSTHDQERARALLEGNKEKADAIAIDDAMYQRFWGPNRGDVEEVYKNLRDEIREQARSEGRDSEWVRVELQRRTGKIETEYAKLDKEDTALTKPIGYDENGQVVQVARADLRQTYSKLFSEADSQVLLGLAENDPAKTDAARLESERRSFLWVSDSTVNDILTSQYTRAREDVELDQGRALRYLEEEKMKHEEERYFAENGKFWTPEERYHRQQQLEHNLERAIDSRAESLAGDNMAALSKTYETQYPGHTLQSIVTENMGGHSQEAGQRLIDKGYLTPYERLRYGIEGLGTKEKLVKDTMKGRTREEIDELDRQWKEDHDGESLEDALSGDLSGDDWIEVKIDLMGRPMTIDDAVAVAREKEELNRPRFFSDETKMVLGSVTELEDLRDALRDPRNANLTPDQQQGLIDTFNAQREVVDNAVETRNKIASSFTDSLINVVSIVVAVVVGAVGSIFTAGAAGAAAIAVIASILATATSIGMRAVLLRNRYGLEQFGVDLAIGVVDAVVAGLTAGMGNRLLGLRQVALVAAEKTVEQGAKQAAEKTIFQTLKGLLAKQIGPLAEKTRAIAFLEKMAAEEASWYSRLTAHGIAQAVETTVQSIPSAIVGQALEKENWEHGNALWNIIKGSGEQVGMGVLQGMALSAGHHLVGAGLGKAWRFARGPELGAKTYARPAAEMAPHEFEAHFKDYEQAHPGATPEEFSRVIDREQALVTEKAEQEKAERESFRKEMDAALREHPDPEVSAQAGKLGDVPITQLGPLDYARVAGIGAPEVTVIIKDGQVHIVVREGASPAAIREVAARLAKEVEPGTGGRVHDAAAALPKDLRGLPIVPADPLLGPRHVAVVLEPEIHLEIGKGATAADIALHADTARAQLRLEGARSKAGKMLEQIRMWASEHGAPPKGTVAYEAHFEVEKLPGIIEARSAELANPDLLPNERASIEEKVEALVDQLQRHQAALDAFDLSPGRGFIAAEDVRGRPYRDAVRAEPEKYATRPIDDETDADRSPMLGKKIEGKGVVEEVKQRAKTWQELDERGVSRKYRHVEGYDADGNRIMRYDEIFDVDDRWRMRGEESAGKGPVGETASRLQIEESVRQANAQGRPDFLIDAQNKSGHGFDKLRVEFNDGDVIFRNGKPELVNAPTLVYGEDKLMGRVSGKSITAIDDTLLKNLRNLDKALNSAKATMPVEKGGLGLTEFQVKALRKALTEGKYRFEVRVFSEGSLGDPAMKVGSKNKWSELQLERMILPRLEKSIGRRLKSRAAKSWMKGHELEVVRVLIDENYLEPARAIVDIENRLGDKATLHERALDMGLSTSNPEDLHQALISLMGEAAGTPGGLKLNNPVYDPQTRLMFDSTGSGRAIQSRYVLPADLQTPTRTAQVAQQIYDHLISKQKSPIAGTLAESVTILDLSGLSRQRIDVLRRSVVNLLESRNQLGRLDKVLFLTGQNPILRPLVTAADVARLLTTSRKK
jgi:hypothetical protein